MFRGWRVKHAAKFGKIEHVAGRLIGVFLITITILFFFGGLVFSETDLFNCLIAMNLLTLFTWIVYISAHNIEKRLYGHFGPRG